MDPVQIPLKNRKGEIVAYALVDEDDAHLAEYRWYLRPGGYAARNKTTVSRSESPDGRGRQQTILLHRDVLGLQVGDGIEVDHRNHQKLDCRRSNLRIVTHAQNGQNYGRGGRGISRHRGVSYRKDRGCWIAYGCLNGRMNYLGGFDTEDEAAVAARAWRAEHMPYATK